MMTIETATKRMHREADRLYKEVKSCNDRLKEIMISSPEDAIIDPAHLMTLATEMNKNYTKYIQLKNVLSEIEFDEED